MFIRSCGGEKAAEREAAVALQHKLQEAQLAARGLRHKNPEAVMNNNITRNNNHLLSWHKDGSKKVKIEPRTRMFLERVAAARVWEVNRQGEDLISAPAREPVLFCYS